MPRFILFALISLTMCGGFGCSCLRAENQGSAPHSEMPAAPAPPPFKPGKAWNFAVSGDSRNCGDVIMPAIAQGASHDHAQFYWHLGDLRAIYDFDEDMKQEARMAGKTLTIARYEDTAWDDFRQNQVAPFGGIPFFLGIGNHETVDHLKTRAEFEVKFADFLNRPELKAQREKDANGKAPDPPKTYYHWEMDGIDFIYLDNATKNEFDPAQMAWVEAAIARDKKDDSVRTVVVGMHEALPNSISANHSMNQEEDGGHSGIQVYKDLLDLRNKKKVYVLASHSHYYMEDIYNTEYWRANGGVLPGWIVGTAGAHRYPLPDPNPAKVAKTNVYGYLLATVNPRGEVPGSIHFEFRELQEGDIPYAISQRYGKEFVHWCFVENTDAVAARPSSTR